MSSRAAEVEQFKGSGGIGTLLGTPPSLRVVSGASYNSLHRSFAIESSHKVNGLCRPGTRSMAATL